MGPLVRYYLHQAGRGWGENNGIGPVYAASPFLQRGYRIGRIFAGLWRADMPVLWSGAKTLARETLRTVGDILTDTRRSPDENPRDEVSRHVKETVQNLIGKLRGRGRKRKGVVKGKKGSKKSRLTKRDIVS